ncbi:F-box/FBD/LRR-repeat protein At1g78750-like [Phalaenopsis equestris]|uniref:F-box/FBD/LRR-repeat protein At1g78750-like n=1 Tax=Phalaenopsis equestris TaxID=78828 RepID=UPI0009E52658|nr:F-box/FBD/LRR-repeat protein At1g78750-like [Phalaenopsis equestris]
METKRRRRESYVSSSTLDPSLSLSSPAAGDVDRLTQLPDVLRLYILSLLPLKFAIRTSVLSSKWRGIWRFRWPQPSFINIFPSPSLPHPEFVSLVDDFFRRRGFARIDCLQIMYSPSALQIPDIKRWLSYAASCSVCEFYLDLSLKASSPNKTRRRGARAAAAAAAPILDFNFRSPTLNHLTLRGFHLSASPPSFRMLLFHLEILNLWEICLSSASLRRILANCPALRSLSIRRCQDLKKVAIPVSAIRLTSLTVVDCRKVSAISVLALGLRSFRFSGDLLKTYFIQSPAMLEDVYISSGTAVPSVSSGDWVKPFGALASLKVLTLCSITLECIADLSAHAEVGFHLFPNLVELQLLMTMMADSNLSDIYGFFKYCPCPRLEKLFLELPMSTCDPSMSTFLLVPTEEPPKVGFSSLKFVKMNGFKGHLNEMLLAGVLLMKSGNLEHFAVVAPRGNNGEKCETSTANFLQCLSTKLSLLPKASAKASIILTENDTSQFRPVHSEV